MKQKFFEIEKNRITLLPNDVWNTVGWAFMVIFPICWLAFLIWAGVFQWFNILYMTIGNTIVMLPFFYIGSRQVIIDGNTQTVQRKSWLGIGKAYHFNAIEGIQMVNETYRNIGGYSYKLTLKKNPYGKSIRLSTAIGKATPHFPRFQNTAVPFIQKLLAANRGYVESTKQSRIETEAAGFKMFHQKGGVFISKPYKITNLIVATVFFGLGLYIVNEMMNDKQFKKEFYWLFAFVAAIVNLGIWGERTLLDPVNKTIEKSYLGLFKKTHPYKRIIGFNTLRHISGISNPTDIRIEIDNGTAIQQITLFSRVGSAKKLQLLMEETKRILIA